MDKIRIMWNYISNIMNHTFNIAGYDLSFLNLTIFSIAFVICWKTVGKIMR